MVTLRSRWAKRQQPAFVGHESIATFIVQRVSYVNKHGAGLI